MAYRVVRIDEFRVRFSVGPLNCSQNVYVFMEQTLVVIKPDGVERMVVGEIISRFERVGLKIAAMKMVKVDYDLAEMHYQKDEAWYKKVGDGLLGFYREHAKDSEKDLGTKDAVEVGKLVQKWLLDFITSGPVVAILLEGPNAVALVRKIVGPTSPLEAPSGTIRGDYCFDSPVSANLQKRPVNNLIHASGTQDEAEFEKKLWFGKELGAEAKK